MNKFNLTLLLLIIILSGCSKDKKDISLIKETSQELEMITSYNEAYKALREGDPYFAAKFVKAQGADSITIHLREDRRHINDLDAKNICSIKNLLVLIKD